MKTLLIDGLLSPGQAYQQVFLLANRSMFPRRLNSQWAFDEPTPKNTIDAYNAKSVLNDEEVIGIMKLCACYAYDHSAPLWMILWVYLRNLPNQERFHTATYLQPIVIAECFAWFALLKVSRN